MTSRMRASQTAGAGLNWRDMDDQAVWKRFENIEAILQQVAKGHAAAIARMDRADDRMDRTDARMDRMDARTNILEARFEKRMRGFEKLVRIGMKEIVELGRLQRESDEKLNALIDSQLRTEATLRGLMDTLRRGGNGHRRGPAH